MKKLAAIAKGKKIVYLYENDLKDIDDFVKLFEEFNNNSAVLFEPLDDYLFKKYDPELIEKIIYEAGVTSDLCYDMIDEFSVFCHKTNLKIAICDKNQCLDLLYGLVDRTSIEGKYVILSDGQISFSLELFKRILSEALKNIEIINKNENIWLEIMRKLNYFTTFQYSIIPEEYNLADVYENLFDEEKNTEDRIKYVVELLDIFIRDADKPTIEKEIPDTIKERILHILYDKEEPESKDREIFMKFMDELAEKDNHFGLWVKCYSYYGGNNYVPENYKISEECLLKLITKHYDDHYANTLGYIYYYGRVNNGIPEYEKAFKYYSLAALSGNVEARYKVGDMYKNGYYLEKNIDIARSIYYSLYDTVSSEFYKDSKNSSLADVSLRIASLSDNDKEYKFAYKLYLQALCAINLRKSKFDSTVRRTIINNIKRLYNEHSDEFNKMGLAVTLNSFYNYSISIDGNTLKFKSPYQQIIHIYPEMYCTYSKELNVKIDGEVIGKIKEKEIVDSFEEEDNVYTFFNELGKVVAKIRINSYKVIIKKENY